MILIRLNNIVKLIFLRLEHRVHTRVKFGQQATLLDTLAESGGVVGSLWLARRFVCHVVLSCTEELGVLGLGNLACFIVELFLLFTVCGRRIPWLVLKALGVNQLLEI